MMEKPRLKGFFLVSDARVGCDYIVLLQGVEIWANPEKMSKKLQDIPSNKKFSVLFNGICCKFVSVREKKYKTQFAQKLEFLGGIFHHYSSYINKSQFLIIALKNMDQKLTEVVQLLVI